MSTKDEVRYTWLSLRSMGNSPIARITILVPIVGYFIIFNTTIIDFLSLHTSICASNECSVSWRIRECIEKGLRECKKCILVLTPNFLSNSGWTKREYDSIFTRELVEKQKVILPVWHEVTPADIYKYSPVLADRYALQWSSGVDEVARRLKAAVDAT